jgi:hypothetical protein
MRTFFIWFFGLIGSGFLGLMLGSGISHDGDSGTAGFFGGMAVFACLRLWLAPKAQRPPGK